MVEAPEVRGSSPSTSGSRPHNPETPHPTSGPQSPSSELTATLESRPRLLSLIPAPASASPWSQWITPFPESSPLSVLLGRRLWPYRLALSSPSPGCRPLPLLGRYPDLRTPGSHTPVPQAGSTKPPGLSRELLTPWSVGSTTANSRDSVSESRPSTWSSGLDLATPRDSRGVLWSQVRSSRRLARRFRRFQAPTAGAYFKALEFDV